MYKRWLKLIGIIRMRLKKLHYLKQFSAGKRARCDRGVDIVINKGKIFIGDNVSIRKGGYIASEVGRISIGNNCSFNRNITIASWGSIEIAEGSSIGPNTVFYDHNHKFNENGMTKGFTVGEIVIGKNCWIGANCTILKNTYIGDNCIIGAGSVVSGTIPSNTIVKSNRELQLTKLEKR